jgi:hypothetical protein
MNAEEVQLILTRRGLQIVEPQAHVMHGNGNRVRQSRDPIAQKERFFDCASRRKSQRHDSGRNAAGRFAQKETRFS